MAALLAVRTGQGNQSGRGKAERDVTSEFGWPTPFRREQFCCLLGPEHVLKGGR